MARVLKEKLDAQFEGLWQSYIPACKLIIVLLVLIKSCIIAIVIDRHIKQTDID